MINVNPSFKILKNGESVTIGYQQVSLHMVFDVKMEDFTRKTRLVAIGHMTKTFSTITYVIVVLRELVCFDLAQLTLNDM